MGGSDLIILKKFESKNNKCLKRINYDLILKMIIVSLIVYMSPKIFCLWIYGEYILHTSISRRYKIKIKNNSVFLIILSVITAYETIYYVLK